MSNQEALNNLAILSEILVDVSKSHITPSKAIDDIRKLDIGSMYELMSKQIELLGLYEEKSALLVQIANGNYLQDDYMKLLEKIDTLKKEIEEMKWTH